jgi:folate-binding protein YgfZ
MEHATVDLGAGEITVRRTDLIGADGFEFAAESHWLQPIEEWAANALGPPSSLDVLDVLRIENRIPFYGIDIDAKNLPQEIGRDSWAISFTKGCYLGQETVARLDSLGHVNRHWVALGFDGSAVPSVGAIIEHDGKPIARITSATYSPRRHSPLALAFVRHGFHEPGQSFSTPWGNAVVLK